MANKTAGVSLWDKFSKMDKEEIKAMNLPYDRKEIRRRFEQIGDALMKSRDAANRDISNEYSRLGKCDPNHIMQLKRNIIGYGLDLEGLHSAYTEFFGDKLDLDRV